jgi:hypothetical protein
MRRASRARMFVRRRRTAAGTITYSIVGTRRARGRVVQDIYAHLGALPQLDNVMPVDVRLAIETALAAASTPEGIKEQVAWARERQELARLNGLFKRFFWGTPPKPLPGERSLPTAASRIYWRNERRIATLHGRLVAAQRYGKQLAMLRDTLANKHKDARQWHRELRRVRAWGVGGRPPAWAARVMARRS